MYTLRTERSKIFLKRVFNLESLIENHFFKSDQAANEQDKHNNKKQRVIKVVNT